MIVLCMIVKDEAPVIRRCLESVLTFIDGWVIADTGSTDETREIVREVMGDLPGELVEHPWVDFAHNRNRVLDRARFLFPGENYALSIDADEVLSDDSVYLIDEDALTQDVYALPVSYAGTAYDRWALLRLDRPWRWEGVVHEIPMLEGATVGRLSSPTVVVRWEGARSRDPNTYAKDAALLEADLEQNPGNPRTQFYLAQSWKDARNKIAARAAYLTRAENPEGWWQERVVALTQAGRLTEELGEDPRRFYLAAYNADPRRAEALMLLAVYERTHGRPAVALLYAREATRIVEPTTDVLFSESWAYGVRPWEERGWAANACGEHAEGTQALKRAGDLT